MLYVGLFNQRHKEEETSTYGKRDTFCVFGHTLSPLSSAPLENLSNKNNCSAAMRTYLVSVNI